MGLSSGWAVATASAWVGEGIRWGDVKGHDDRAAALDLARKVVVAVLDASLRELGHGAGLTTKLSRGHLAETSVGGVFSVG